MKRPTMTNFDIKNFRQHEDAKYLKTLNRLDPDRIGLRIICPSCKKESSLKLPEDRYSHSPLTIACPIGCGAYGEIDTLSPAPAALEISRALRSNKHMQAGRGHDTVTEPYFNARFAR